MLGLILASKRMRATGKRASAGFSFAARVIPYRVDSPRIASRAVAAVPLMRINAVQIRLGSDAALGIFQRQIKACEVSMRYLGLCEISTLANYVDCVVTLADTTVAVDKTTGSQ